MHLVGYTHIYWNILTMHGTINVKSPNNTDKWQMGFNSQFKGLISTNPYENISSRCLKNFICAASKRCSSLFFSSQASLPNFNFRQIQNTYIQCGQSVQLLNVKPVGATRNQQVLNIKFVWAVVLDRWVTGSRRYRRQCCLHLSFLVLFDT